jgi:hypothetical protein
MIGDSITEGSASELKTAMSAKGFTPTINGKASRRLSEGTSDLDGISVLSKDLTNPQIANSKIFVVALGTNSGITTASAQKTLGLLKSANASAKIYWVNLGVINSLRDRGQLDFNSSNQIIASLADVTTINWASTIKPEFIANDGLGVHPSAGAGKQAFATLVANSLSGSSGGTLGGSGGICSLNQLPGKNDAEKVWNFFLAKGWPAERIAGVMGNMYAESGITAMRMQGVYGRTVSSRDVDINSGLGYGVVQWTPVRKLIQLSIDGAIRYEEIDTIEYQLEFLWAQLQGTDLSFSGRSVKTSKVSEKSAGIAISNTNTVLDAAIAFAVKYERCADCASASSASVQNRVRQANNILAKYSPVDFKR